MATLRNAVWIFVLVLVGCASLGLPTADTLNQKIAVGYGTVTQVAATTTQLLQAKKITADDAQNVLTQATAAKVSMDIAKGMSNTNPTAAQTKLEMAIAVLTAAQVYLSSREGK